MEIIDERAQIATVAERFKEQQYDRETGRWLYAGREAMYSALKALPATATRADVAAIMGDDHWTGPECSEPGCGNRAFVLLGQPPDYESSTVYLCDGCIGKLFELAKARAGSERALPPEPPRNAIWRK